MGNYVSSFCLHRKLPLPQLTEMYRNGVTNVGPRKGIPSESVVTEKIHSSYLLKCSNIFKLLLIIHEKHTHQILRDQKFKICKKTEDKKCFFQ